MRRNNKPLRRFFDSVTRNKGKDAIRNVNDACRFIQSILEHDNALELLDRLSTSEKGLDGLQQAISLDQSPEFLNNSLTWLLNYLGKDELAIPTCKRFLLSILQKIILAPFLLSNILGALSKGEIDDPLAIGWLLLHTLSAGDDVAEDLRGRETVKELSSRLRENEKAKSVASRISTLMSGALSKVEEGLLLSDIKDVPGGRHDNDFLDYRSVRLVPTSEELLCAAEVHIPERETEDVTSPEGRARALDRQFRLLREDMVGALREELEVVLNPSANPKCQKMMDSRTLRKVKFVDVIADGSNSVSYVRASFMQPITRACNDSKKRKKMFEDFWDRQSRLLRRDSLVFIIRDQRLIRIATVHLRDLKDLSKDRPTIGLVFHSDKDLEDILTEVQANTDDTSLVQASASFFAYEPVLERLRAMDDIPLSDILLNPTPSSMNICSSSDSLKSVISSLKRTKDEDNLRQLFGTKSDINLDRSQRKAVLNAFESRVSLTQGPPGTGKSFCGALVAKGILDNSDKTIVCVCATNHALDQFLEDLIDIGVPEKYLLRLGGSPKISSRILPMTLRNASQQSSFDSSERRTFAALKGRVEELEDSIKDAKESLINANQGVGWTVYASHLENYYAEHRKAFRVGKDSWGSIVGKNGKKLRDIDLWKLWGMGKSCNAFRRVLDDSKGIWDLTKAERRNLKNNWKQEIIDGLAGFLLNDLSKYDTLQLRLRDLRRRNDFKTIKSKRIIGCTTNGAAKYASELQGVKAGVLLVEEAGEILEPQILTSLSSSTNQLILIGDHKQLRPKVTMYSLQVEANRGFDLNRSLFERLVLSDFPLTTLEKQHRMRPEISELVRKLTYPTLRDSDKVESYPALRGVQKNIVFIDHREIEDERGELERKGEGGASKTNTYEAQMVAGIARYLLQQGYSPTQLVVVTPYLGQLHQIQDELSGMFNVLLSDRDAADMLNAGGTLRNSKTGNKGKSSLRAATIDNYQGEESDVVILSLVRSNESCSIGFLKEPERINVMLSRARHGMLILGNLETLTGVKNERARLIWKTIEDYFENQGSIFCGFPVVCQRHPERRRELCIPTDFDQHSPNGGCAADCTAMLSCGQHLCPLKCHSGNHRNQNCRVKIWSSCPKGHTVSYECYEKKPEKCSACDEIRKEAKRREKEKERKKELQAKEKADHAVRIKEREELLLQEKKKLENDMWDTQREIHERRLDVKIETVRREQKVHFAQKREKIEDEIKKLKVQADRRLQSIGRTGEDECDVKAYKSDNRRETRKQGAAEKLAATCSGTMQEAQSVEEVDEPSADDSTFSTFSWGQTLTAEVEMIARSLIGEDPYWMANTFRVKFDDSVMSVFDRSYSQAQKYDPQKAMSKALNAMASKKWSQAFSTLDTMKGLEPKLLSLICRAELGDIDAMKDMENAISIQRKTVTEEVVFSLGIVLGYLAKNANDSSKDKGKFARKSMFYALAYFLSKDRKNKTRSNQCHKDEVQRWCDNEMKIRFKECANTVHKEEESSNTSKRRKAVDVIKTKWEKEKAVKAARNQAMDDLMTMTALESVKTKFFGLYQWACLTKRRNMSLHEKRLNVCLSGNPGTGKTRVARLYAMFLAEIEVLSKNNFVETSGSKLLMGGVDEVKKLVEKLEKDGGGLLFIDEAYQLDPRTEYQGKRILDYLLTEVENKVGTLVVAVAGYKNRMEKMFEHNEGLPSRFPITLQFEDYSDDELLAIMQSLMKKKFPMPAFSVEGGIGGKYMRILIRRLGRGRGKVGFGNARAVATLFEQVMEHQACRIAKEEDEGRLVDEYKFVRSDLLGPDPIDSLMKSPAWKQLKEMIGLDSVKSSIRSIVETLKTNAELELLEKPLNQLTLNRLFLGPPGSGKTSVASLYAKILKDIGLLSKGDIILKKPNDFIGAALGESEKNTSSILKAADGCVLVIDEAYGLFANSGGKSGIRAGSDPFRTAVIDTLVGEVQNVPGEDRCVLMLGYKEQMEDMMNESNPGLKRRFSVDDAFLFDDYNDEELQRILNLKLKRRGLKASFASQRIAISVLAKQRRRPNFGNGGAVENFISTAVARMNERMASLTPAERAASQELIGIDFDPDESASVVDFDVDKVFDDLMGCHGIKQQMQEYKASILYSQKTGQDPFEDLQLNFKFTGSSGTGKTSVARKMGELFHGLGVLDSKDIVECSASDLVAEYVGQTAQKTRKRFEEALGKVLFIDEAYRLNPTNQGVYAKEALDEIVDQLTKPEVKGNLVVILAGYQDDIDELMRCNAGLSSRFSEGIVFEDFTVKECWCLLRRKLQDRMMSLKIYKQYFYN